MVATRRVLLAFSIFLLLQAEVSGGDGVMRRRRNRQQIHGAEGGIRKRHGISVSQGRVEGPIGDGDALHTAEPPPVASSVSGAGGMRHATPGSPDGAAPSQRDLSRTDSSLTQDSIEGALNWERRVQKIKKSRNETEGQEGVKESSVVRRRMRKMRRRLGEGREIGEEGIEAAERGASLREIGTGWGSGELRSAFRAEGREGARGEGKGEERIMRRGRRGRQKDAENVPHTTTNNNNSVEGTGASEVEGVHSTTAVRKRGSGEEGGGTGDGVDVEVDFSILDISCLVGRFGETGGLVAAPRIKGARLAKYLRRKSPHTPHQRFLVALYRCEEGFHLSDSKADRLYCSKNRWLGRQPECISGGEEEDKAIVDKVMPTVPLVGSKPNEEGDSKPRSPPSGISSHSSISSPSQLLDSLASDPCAVGGIGSPSADPNQPSGSRGRCEHTCVVVDGAAKCGCFKGYRLDSEDGRTCRDIDECAEGTSGCGSVCSNRPGSFKCDCPQGLRLSGDDRTCIDINECLLRNGHGPCQDTCQNTWGGYKCGCEGIPGTRLSPKDSHSCEDVDECAGGAAGCSHGCVNSFGSAFCTCPEGFLLGADWKTCHDIDECAAMEESRDEEEEGEENKCEHGCRNTIGSYECLKKVDEEKVEEGKVEQEKRKQLDTKAEEEEEEYNKDKGEEEVNEDNEKEEYDAVEEKEEQEKSKKGESNGRKEAEEYGGEKEKEMEKEKVEENDKEDGNGEHGKDEREDEEGDDEEGDDEEGDDEEGDDEEGDDEDEESGEEEGENEDVTDEREGEMEETEKEEERVETTTEKTEEEREKSSESVINANEMEENGDKGGEAKIEEGVEELKEKEEDGGEDVMGGRKEEMEEEEEEEDEGGEDEEDEDGQEEDEEGDDEDEEEDEETEKEEEKSGVTAVPLNEVNGGGVLKELEEEGERSGNASVGGKEERGETIKTVHGVEHSVSCNAGFRKVTKKDVEDEYSIQVCEDVDECSEHTDGCSDICTNTPGGYRCECEAGYQLSSDLRTCEDLDECIDGVNHNCSHTCVNIPGGHRCSCPEGLRLSENGKTCEDLDECSDNVPKKHNCSHTCVNLPGGHRCSCPEGHRLSDDEKTCVDEDECAGDHACSHECVNTLGSYSCECSKGYKLGENGRSCEDLNECVLDNPCDHTCRNTPGSYECECFEGYELSEDGKRCDDVDECRGNPCSHMCANLPGGYRCECPLGYRIGRENKTCHDVDECLETNSVEYLGLERSDCSHECVNTLGSFKCACPKGYVLKEDGRSCEDIDECSGVRSDDEDHFSNGRNKIFAMTENPCSHVCVNFPGHFRCECPSGYTLGPDERTCQDVDECLLSPCSHECVNVEGGYKCVCPIGYELGVDLHACDDVDECEKGNVCSHRCHNDQGSFRCTCPVGYVLKEDGRNCEDVNECSEDNGGCSHSCMNLEGRRKCTCPDGHRLEPDGMTCGAIESCGKDNGGCSNKCTDLFDGLGVRCDCPEGYRLLDDKRTCKDIDECSEGGSANCTHHCLNTPGGFRCGCRNGYVLDPIEKKTCLDVDECAGGKADCHHGCANTHGSYECKCKQGYRLSEDRRSCEDVNECAVNNGGCSHLCINTDGGHACDCPEGFIKGKSGGECEDVDECSNGNGGCSGICHNIPGGHHCGCPRGYELQKDGKACADVDECQRGNGGCSHDCINTVGSFRCSCPEGFRPSRRHAQRYRGQHRGRHENHHLRACEDVDECAKDEFLCEHGCINTYGSFRCTCPDGYTVNATNARLCADVDECSEVKSLCQQECVNTAGSYRCECRHGYRLVDDRLCADVDECSNGEQACTHGCINLEGGYKCSCPRGLRVVGHECREEDECASSPCSHECVNTPRGFRCTCPSGYTLNGTICEDVNECLGENKCSHECVNVPGSYRCTCRAGYIARGDACEDVDECRDGTPCSHACVNTPGSYICECPSGYRLSGGSCVDVDECDEKNPCDYHCTNTPGSYNCLCPSGYKKVEDKCLDMDECAEERPCSHTCVNTPGSYRCACPPGHKLEGKTCLEVIECPRGRISRYGRCVATGCSGTAVPTPWGDLQCSMRLSNSSSEYPVGTRCRVRCRPGFKSFAPSTIILCSPEGKWVSESPSTTPLERNIACVPLACPRLKAPQHGRITPESCSSGKSFPGQRCTVSCRRGYRVSGGQTYATCTATNDTSSPTWSPTQLSSVWCERDTLNPFIQCPPNMKLTLPLQQKTMHVTIPQPKSNMEWSRYIDSVPAWGKRLEKELPTGTTVITFYARSPMSNMTALCRLFVEIVDLESPRVTKCPRSFEVQVEHEETSKVIFWEEPIFTDNVRVETVQQNKHPGEQMDIGVHRVTYVAVDDSGNKAHCQFVVHVKGADSRNHFKSHKTPQKVLICPNLKQGKVIHVYPWQVPQGCNPIRSRRPIISTSNFGINSLTGGISNIGQGVINLDHRRRTQEQAELHKLQRTGGWQVVQEAVVQRVHPQPDQFTSTAVTELEVRKGTKRRHKQGIILFRRNCCP